MGETCFEGVVFVLSDGVGKSVDDFDEAPVDSEFHGALLETKS